MKRFAIVLCIGLAGATSVRAEDQPLTKRPPTTKAAVRLIVQPGEVVKWQSPNIGHVDRLSLYIAGRAAGYAVEPHTRSCVAYGYEAGVAVRLTDCSKGRRVPYVRIRAVSAALKPVVIRLRLN